MKLKMTKKKLLAAIVSTALLCGVGVGGTVAWLHDSAQVTNKFDLADVSGEISEDFEDGEEVKESITIKNNHSDVPVYIRVALSACWMDGSDIAPLEAELSLASLPEGWEEGADGFYYYLSPVDVNGEITWNLQARPTEANKKEAEGTGWQFRVDVSAQLIQAEPEDAVNNAWGVTIDADGVHPVTQNP